jgi:hypothetical protein
VADWSPQLVDTAVAMVDGVLVGEKVPSPQAVHTRSDVAVAGAL